MRKRLFRREWVFPALMVAFVNASAHATRDELSAQAATDLHCNSVSIIQSSPTQFLAIGCGQDRTYDCVDDVCTSNDVAAPKSRTSSDEDDAAADAIASAIMDIGCACASAAMTPHGSHGRSSSSHGSRHKH